MTSDYQPGGTAPGQAGAAGYAPSEYEAQTGEARHDGTVWDLLMTLSNQSMRLVRQEVDLAKTEMRETAETYARNGAYLGAGAFVAFAGALVLLASATMGLYVILNNVLPWHVALWLSPLIVGAVVGLVGYALIQKAISTFKRTSLKPDKTIETIREDTQWVKDRLSRSAA